MPVPVAHVVRAKSGVQVVEEDLLPVRVGAESHGTLLGAWSRRDRKRDDVCVLKESARKYAPNLRVRMAEAVGHDGPVRALRKNEAA